MRQTEFLSLLEKNAAAFDWNVTNGKLVGYHTSTGRLFNVITAVSFAETGSYNIQKFAGTRAAAKRLGLSVALMNAIYSPENRGHGQVLRGKLLKAVNNAFV